MKTKHQRTQEQRTCLVLCDHWAYIHLVGEHSHRGVSPGLTKLRLVKAPQTVSCISRLLKIHFTLFHYTCRYKWSQLEWATFNTLHTEISQPPKSLLGFFPSEAHMLNSTSGLTRKSLQDRDIQCGCLTHQCCSLCSQRRNAQRGQFPQERIWIDCAGNEIQISQFYCPPSQVIKPHADV